MCFPRLPFGRFKDLFLLCFEEVEMSFSGTNGLMEPSGLCTVAKGNVLETFGSEARLGGNFLFNILAVAKLEVIVARLH